MTATDPIPTVVAQACETLPTYNSADTRTRCYSLWTDGKISFSDSTIRYNEKTGLFQHLQFGHEESRPYAPPGLHWAHTHVVLGNDPHDPMVHFETTDEAIRRIGAEIHFRCEDGSTYAARLWLDRSWPHPNTAWTAEIICVSNERTHYLMHEQGCPRDNGAYHLTNELVRFLSVKVLPAFD